MRWLALLLFLSCSAWAQQVLQVTETFGAFDGGVQLQFGAPASAGSVVVVATFFAGSTSLSSVTDSEGNTYQLVASQEGLGGSFMNWPQRLYFTHNLAAGGAPLVITFNGSPSNYLEAGAVEYSGVFPQVASVDKRAVAAGAGNPVLGPVTTVGGDLVFASLICEGTVTDISDAGFVRRAAPNGDLVADFVAPVAAAAMDVSFTAIAPCNEAMSMVAVFGARDAGVDGGALDAGSGDAGADGGAADSGLGEAGVDAGPPRRRELTVGCACSSVDLGAWTLGWLALLAWRRHRID